MAERKVRYAVVGAGHIAQVAVLPAFDHAANSQLVAVISGDDDKRRELSRRYGLEHAVDYDDYDDLLAKGVVDAVYIALPNHLHADYTIRAAQHGVHVLCEKPMAVTEQECEQMIRACEDNGVKLMIAYRLHFEAANMHAVEVVTRGDLGDVRYFTSSFSQEVMEGDPRLYPLTKGGGAVYDLGIYCINAARYLLRDEPTEVLAASVSAPRDARFADCDETTTAILKFPGERLATFTCSFNGGATSSFRVVGTKGDLRMDPAFNYQTELSYEVTVGEQTTTHRFGKRDQFAPELVHFSDCVIHGHDPEPGGLEGLADVRIIRAIHEAAGSGHAVAIEPVRVPSRPSLAQEMKRPAVDEPDQVKVSGPSEPGP